LLDGPELDALDAAFALGSVWVRQCLSQHSACQNDATKHSSQPQRFIHIDHTGENMKIRLVDSSEKNGPYLALSYCWGTSQTMTTSKATLTLRRAGIEFQDMPRTFQEAILLTHKFGLQYLWIDALCIIQDDARDWAIESEKMDSVYRDAYFTIAADVGSDSNSGFLVSRFQYTQQRLACRGDSGRYCQVGCRFRQTERQHQYSESTPFPHLALANRAWAYQESLLSKRILHFGDTELCWVCNEGARCECTSHRHADTKSGRLLRNPPPGHRFKREQDLTRVWQRIVEDFTKRDLTHRMDKLPAISGVAWQMARFLSVVDSRGISAGDRISLYYAGLWLEDLPVSLLWNAMPDRSREHTRPPQYRAPSFSWASLDGPVAFVRWFHLPSAINIEEIECVPKGPDPAGQVSSGYLTVEGMFAPVLTGTVRRGEQEHFAIRKLDPTPPRPITRFRTISEMLSPAPPPPTWEFIPDVRADIVTPDFEFHDMGHFILLISDGGGGSPGVITDSYWLVLRRSPTVRGALERVGFASLHGDGNERTFFNSMGKTSITIV
jgi:hypothetical protein